MEHSMNCPACGQPTEHEGKICFACKVRELEARNATAHPEIACSVWLDAFCAIEGQITAMLNRSEQYQREEEADEDFQQGEIHARTSSVLRELKRLASAFKARASNARTEPFSPASQK